MKNILCLFFSFVPIFVLAFALIPVGLEYGVGPLFLSKLTLTSRKMKTSVYYITDIISVIRFSRGAFFVWKRLSRRSELCSDLLLSRGLVRFGLVNFFSTNPNRH